MQLGTFKSSLGVVLAQNAVSSTPDLAFGPTVDRGNSGRRRTFIVRFSQRTFIVSENMGEVVSVLQDPNSRLDYTLDWSHELRPSDALVDSTWESSNANLILADDNFSDTTATVWASFGTDVAEGDQYEATNHIAKDGGGFDSRTIFVKVESQ